MAANFRIECTGCGGCSGCPMELDIPYLLSCLQAMERGDGAAQAALLALPGDRQPKSCVGCGHCMERCPQHIDISGCMLHLTGLLMDQREAG